MFCFLSKSFSEYVSTADDSATAQLMHVVEVVLVFWFFDLIYLYLGMQRKANNMMTKLEWLRVPDIPFIDNLKNF